MRRVPLPPRVHVFVCNHRRPGSPLGPGCGASGDAVLAAARAEVAARSAYATAWITATSCMGICPARGCAVAIYPAQELFSEVEAGDVSGLTGLFDPAEPPADAALALLLEMEDHQRTKVWALARRLKPGLTLEDVRNPHDFPELADPDWHYEDGVLTGLQSAVAALRARGRP